MESEAKRSIPLFMFNIIMTSVALAMGIWLTIWSFLPPPQPSTPRQLRYATSQGRQPGPIVFGVFNAIWTAAEASILLLCALQLLTWRNPQSRITMRFESLLWMRISIIVGLLIALRAASGAFCMATVLPNPLFSDGVQKFDPDKKVAFGVGWGISLLVHFLALLSNTLWMKHFRNAIFGMATKEQAEIAMQETEDERRANERLAFLRSQYSQSETR
ncbi:hypothetical protein OC846_005782 [Tilletia horrida]|uniref:Transmembrane protein n=1 Tax=Tilletia horrida TaxID=155126 RepID=A0AAN6GKM0_9BASI|nr:hypothetical protein OC846_005782 [Tilletia horrida]KAK0563424.1 hypothetical protein OC861_004821 [Tilletia horrida]